MSERGCPKTRWDGGYSYRCGLGGVSGICHLHGPFASAFGEVEPESTDPFQDCTIDLVKPEPGQTVVVTVAKLPAPHILEAMGEQLKRSFPDNRCVVMEEGTALSVEDDAPVATITREEAESVLYPHDFKLAAAEGSLLRKLKCALDAIDKAREKS